jgi:hypothetical protein
MIALEYAAISRPKSRLAHIPPTRHSIPDEPDGGRPPADYTHPPSTM